MEKCDAKPRQRSRLSVGSSSKPIKRPLPVPPPAVPQQPPSPLPTHSIRSDDPIDIDVKDQHEIDETTPSAAAAAPTSAPPPHVVGERKHKKRKTKSVERLRDQSHNIELSDSDDEIAIPYKIPTINIVDETDASAPLSPLTSEAANLTSQNTSTSDEPAICDDSLATITDANTFSDKNQLQLSYDEILKIEESFDSDNPDVILHNIVVDIHNEPTIELRIHESDSDPAITASPSTFIATKLTKEQSKVDVEQERCHSEDDAIDLNAEAKEKGLERLVQSDSEILSKTPLELVVECDINENVIVNESKSNGDIIDLDHNHNDIAMSMEQKSPAPNHNGVDHSNETESVRNGERFSVVQPNEVHRYCDSVSSRSSCDSGESDNNEPDYATVDTRLNMVSFENLE